jgi:tetratricopeptide (TPR) repeat protein
VPHARCAAATPRTLDEVRACSDDDLPVAIAQLQTALAGDQSLHRLLAAAHARAGNLELAEPHARAALQREADDAEMLFVIGVAAEKRDEVLEAIDNFEAALEIEPDFWRPLFHLGKASMSVGMISDAHEYLQQVLELNPGHAPTLALMAKFDGVDVLELQQELNEVLRKPPQASTTDNLSDFM